MIIGQEQETAPRVRPPWVLVFGGVTREGNRRARRNIERALEAGMDVVWFDGFEETFEGTDERVPLAAKPSEGRLTVIGYGDLDKRTWSGRLHGGPSPGAATASAWRRNLRRLGLLFRPWAGWKAIRSEVIALTGLPDPSQIIYCDDYSLTSAWHAARLWVSTPVSMSFDHEP